MGIVETVLGALFALVVGPLCLLIGRSYLADAVHILRAPSATAGTRRSGLATVTGTVTPSESTLTGPLSGAECVVYALGEDTRGWVRDPFRVYGWKAAGGATVVTPFALETAAGRVTIEPRRPADEEPTAAWDEALTRTWSDPFALPVTATDVYPAGASVDGRLAAAIESHPRLHDPGDTKTRYREWTVRPGDTVSVVGTVGPDTTAGAVTVTNDGTFFLSTTSLRRLAVRRFVVGGLVAGFGAALLIWVAYRLGVTALLLG